MSEEILVSIICNAYNHEKYIRKALESFLMQKTNFAFEVLVHDDASTDKTADIIREYEAKYPNIIKPIYQTENQYSKKINNTRTHQLPRAKGKYIAVCEGDDFWTSEEKLQKQVDYLEAHPECSLCGHAAYYANEDSSLRGDKFFRPYDRSKIISIEEALSGWKIATNSMMYPRIVRGDGNVPFQGDCPNGDYALFCYCASKGNIYYIDELMSAYRVNSVGSLNWNWRKDRDRFETARLKFVSMLDRMDLYLDYKYTNIIDKQKTNVLFDLYISEPKKLLKNKELYKKLSIVQKIKAKVKAYCPALYSGIRKIVRGKKGRG